MGDMADYYIDIAMDNDEAGMFYRPRKSKSHGCRSFETPKTRHYGPNKKEKYPRDKRSLELANTLKGLLKKEGIKIFNINQAGSGSCYISFYEERLGKCRVGNHSEKGKLGYRWQLRWDIKEIQTVTTKGHKQFYYPSNELGNMVKHIKNYLNKILRNESEFV